MPLITYTVKWTVIFNELVKDVIGIKEEKELQVFTGNPKVECDFCADVPNLIDIDSENE